MFYVAWIMDTLVALCWQPEASISTGHWEEDLKAGSCSCERSLDVRLPWLLPKERLPVNGDIWIGIEFKLQRALFLPCYWKMVLKLVPNNSVSYNFIQGDCSYRWSSLFQTDNHILLWDHTSILALVVRSFIQQVFIDLLWVMHSCRC